MSTGTTVFDSRAPLAVFTINRPLAGNSMTWEMYDALVRACEHVDGTPELRAFIIRANGEAFCTGTDISQFTSFTTREDGIEYERRLEAVVGRIERVGVTTIAQVQGIAAGGGCAIALACDLRVCTPTARFGVPIARTLGNALSYENCARLVEHFGIARTKAMLIAGTFIDAAEAVACGVVTRMAESQNLERVTHDLATTVTRNAPLTIRAAKAALVQLSERRRADGGDVAKLVAECYASEDFREGVSAFLAKRPSHFTGR